VSPDAKQAGFVFVALPPRSHGEAWERVGMGVGMTIFGICQLEKFSIIGNLLMAFPDRAWVYRVRALAMGIAN